MAAFSKRHYLILARALRLSRGNVLEEAQAVEEDNPTDQCKPTYWARYGMDTAAKYIADALALDNSAFKRDHFIAVVKGEKDAHSRP